MSFRAHDEPLVADLVACALTGGHQMEFPEARKTHCVKCGATSEFIHREEYISRLMEQIRIARQAPDTG